MTNASRIIMQDVDNSYVAQGVASGISGFVGRFLRGPINDPSMIITNPTMLRKIFGSKDSGTGDLLLADRALANGGSLRIVNVGHYTDVTDPATLSAVKATAINVENSEASAGTLFKVKPKYAGAAYNKLKVKITPVASTGSFTMEVYIEGEEYYTLEQYSGLRVTRGTAPEASFLREVAEASLLIDVEYSDTSALATDSARLPKAATLSFTGGSDGAAIVDSDYVGSNAGKTGFHALSPYTDMADFAAPAITTAVVNNGGANYAESRKDIEFLAALPNSLTTVAALVTARQLITVNSKYYSVWAGGLKVKNPQTGQTVEITSVADILGIGHRTDSEYYPWFSQAQLNRGTIANALGVVRNFGNPSDFNDLNLLAQAGINVTVLDRGLVSVRGNYTGQSAGTSKASYRNIVRLVIYIKRSLRPTLERYLEEPNDFNTWKNLYNEVKPFLNYLEDNRAVYPGGAVWKGDQYASKMSELTLNTEADLAMGKYKAELHLNPINSINELTLSISLNNVSLEIEDYQ